MSKQYNEIEKYCAYCEHSVPTYDKDRVLCDKKGIVSGGYKCRRFSYDPLKRTPIKKILKADE
jgi:hypothetical protein